MNKRSAYQRGADFGLIEAAQAGDESAAERVIEQNLALVISIARRYAYRAELDDLVQIGSLGLLKAVQRFDTGMGVCFSTYAVPLIAGEIKRYLRDDGMIKVSRRLKELAYAASKLNLRSTSERGRPATIDELERELMADRSDIIAALESGLPCLSIDGMTEASGEVRELGSDCSMENEALDRVTVGELIDGLEPVARAVLRLRYFEGRTQREIGAVLGLTQVQVSRTESRAVRLLRERLGGEADL